jgi:prohibitin 1
VVLAFAAFGCASTLIEPGHRGLLFDPKQGLGREVLQPGAYRIPASGRLDDFDVMYARRVEPLTVMTSEGLKVDVRADVLFRPIISELYFLDTEIGPAYYDEVVGPEFRAAARQRFAATGVLDVVRKGTRLEDEIESDLRMRIKGKHIEVAAVTLESVKLPPEIEAAVERRLRADLTAGADQAEEGCAKREADGGSF